MSGKVYISGGGKSKETYKLDHIFFNLPRGAKILYIPVGLKRDIIGFEGCHEWFTETLSMHTKEKLEVEMWISLKRKEEEDIDGFDAIYMGGASNTYKFLKNINDSGFISPLVNFVKKGGSIYGGSSGAVILGKNIGTVEEENNKNYKHKDGLDLVGGYSILCHYDGSQNKKVSSYLKKYGNPIIALPENTGLIVYDSKIKVYGYGKCHIFELNGKMGIFGNGETIHLDSNNN